MADKDKPKKDNARGRTKASLRSGTQTALNKARAAQSRQNRLQRAAERRRKTTYMVPMDAMIPATELPKKAQAAMEFLVDSHGQPIMVPNPKRGMSVRGKQCGDAVTKREIQAEKITRKRETRARLKSLGSKQRAQARVKGDRQFMQRDEGAKRHFQRCAPRRLRAPEPQRMPSTRLDLTHILTGA